MEFKVNKKGPKILLPEQHSDRRGSIKPLLHEHNGSCVIIDTVPSVQRANHYHKKDYHYCYIISGELIYYERPAASTKKPERFIFCAGDMFYTGPMTEHCMYFEKPTIFLAFGGGTRKQEEYEADLVRVGSLHDEFIESS